MKEEMEESETQNLESEKKNLPQEDEAQFNKEKRGNHVTFF